MYKKQGKTYVINDNNTLKNSPGVSDPSFGVSASYLQGNTGKRRDPLGSLPREEDRSSKKAFRSTALRSDLPAGLLVAAAYLLGPLAPAFLRRAKGDLTLSAIGGGSFLLLAFLAWRSQDVFGWIASGTVPIFLWLAAVNVLTLIGFTIWARTILMVGLDRRLDPKNLPAWCRHPVFSFIIGFFAPGASYLVGGHPFRAAVALWLVTPLFIALFVYVHASGLWAAQKASGAASGLITLDGLELILLGSILLGLVAAFAWIAHALDGTRRRVLKTSIENRSRGDLFGLLLFAAVVVLALTFDPAAFSQDVHTLAVSLHEQGFRRIPLVAARTADHFDPSNPMYASMVADIEEESGNLQKARVLRAQIKENSKLYQAVLGQEAFQADKALLPPEKRGLPKEFEPPIL